MGPFCEDAITIAIAQLIPEPKSNGHSDQSLGQGVAELIDPSDFLLKQFRLNNLKMAIFTNIQCDLIIELLPLKDALFV